MQKWDYLWVKLAPNKLGEEWQDEIKNVGEEGWELVSVERFQGEFYFFFKREVPSPKKSAVFHSD